MNLVAVQCNQCGASLRISETTNFVTCEHCHSQLAVQRMETATFTEAIKAIDQKTTQIAADLEIMRLQSRIEMLDREWDSKKAPLMIGGSEGKNGEPSRSRAKVWAILFVSAGIVLVVGALAVEGFHMFVLFGVLAIIAGVMTGSWESAMADNFQSLQARYAMERRRLVHQLHAAEKPGQR